jgi:hypothetical protein
MAGHAPGAGLPSRNAVCLADNSRYYLRLAKATDKTGKTGIWKTVKGNLAMINTGESAHITVGGFTVVPIGSTEMRIARIICPISLLTSMGFALLRLMPRSAM